MYNPVPGKMPRAQGYFENKLRSKPNPMSLASVAGWHLGSAAPAPSLLSRPAQKRDKGRDTREGPGNSLHPKPLRKNDQFERQRRVRLTDEKASSPLRNSIDSAVGGRTRVAYKGPGRESAIEHEFPLEKIS